MKEVETISIAAQKISCSRKTIYKLLHERHPKVRMDIIIKITEFLSNHDFNSNEVERNIIWIGSSLGKGLPKPRLPFNLYTRAGARFISAICNDGCITRGSQCIRKGKFNYGTLIYINTNKDIRNSVVKDALSIFGGNKSIINEGDDRLYFPSIFREILEGVTEFKGSKSENNPPIPAFILKRNDMACGWIEQVIADEGDVRYYPYQYERAIIWRRSLDITDIVSKRSLKHKNSLKHLPQKLHKLIHNKKCKIIEDETKILDKLGISYQLYPISLYSTKNERIKIRWQIRISGNKNLRKLRNLIKIPDTSKDKKFTKMLNGYRRGQYQIKPIK